MNCFATRVLLFCAAALTLATSCKKSAKKTTCTSTLYGYSAYQKRAMGVGYFTDSFSTAGTISYSSLLTTGTTALVLDPYSSTAAFNNMDNCYYCVNGAMGAGMGLGIIHKLSGSTFSDITGPSTPITGLTYNRFNNKFYCIANAGTSSAKLAEVNISGSTYTLSTVLTPLHGIYGQYNGATLAVDDNTGNMYFITGDTTTEYVEKYVPGTSSSTVTNTITGAFMVFGIRYNKNDNKMYAIKETPAGASNVMLVIDPAAGTASTLTTMSFDVNPEFYTTVIDPCSNHIIVSTMTTAFDSSEIGQFNTSGAMVQHNIVPGILQGMAVGY